MRVSAITVGVLLFSAQLLMAAPGGAQELDDVTIRLELHNESLVTAFKKIEKQCNYYFAYKEKQVKNSAGISLKDEKRTLRETLTLILANTDLSFRQVGNSIIIVKQGKSEQVREGRQKLTIQLADPISGKVTDDNGKPLAGVTVLEKGTTNGTQTNANGEYTLNVSSPDAVLEISYIGYANLEINVDKRSVVNLQLHQTNREMDQVVVVGYGTQRRKAVTGAVSKVDLNTIRNTPTTNVSQALRGTVAGVVFRDNARPGQGGSILIRGQRSITASNDPLVVLDGMIYPGGLSDINPNDVESMEVLKDASAGAIYGTRAANGVILITTKRGRTEKPTITFNTYYGVQGYAKKIKMQSPEQYLNTIADFREQNTGTRPDQAGIVGILSPVERANLTAGRTINPYDVFTHKNAPIQTYDLGISGRTDRVNYYVSGALTKEQGIVKNDIFKRITVRTNLETKVTGWLKTGIDAQFTQGDRSGIEADRNIGLSPYASIYFDDEKKHLRSQPLGPGFPQSSNPIFNSSRQLDEDISNRLFANIYAVVDVPFVRGLSYRINYSPNQNSSRNYFYSPLYIQPIENANDSGLARRTNSMVNEFLLENIVNYRKLFAGNHSIDLTLLYSRTKTNFETTTLQAERFRNDALGFNSLVSGRIQQPMVFDAHERNGISSMARLNYGFKDRYFITLTTRRDGSSVFGPNNKFAVFPSAAVAWVVSDESFMKNARFLNYLKLRASYGKVGNQAIQPYATVPRLSNVFNTFGNPPVLYTYGDGSQGTPGLVFTNIVNNNLKWETTKKLNFAADFEVLRGRLGGTVEVYDEDTEDLILNKTLPSVLGFDRILTNIGSTNNRGIEVSLNSVNMNRGNFRWTTNLAYSTNQNKIVSLGGGKDKDGRELDDIASGWFIGKPINSFYDFVFDGIYQEGDPGLSATIKPGYVRLRDLDGNGTITPTADRAIVGQLQPKHTIGLTNNFSYGGLSLNFTLTAMTGWIAPLLGYDPRAPYANNIPNVNLADYGYWTKENRSTTRPSLGYPNSLRHSYYVSRDFLRLQTLTLAYELKNTLDNLNINVSAARFYVSGRNLLTFTKWPGWDPENVDLGFESNRQSWQGFDRWPMSRSVVVGLNLSF
jgi:TonB-linked SusC/RagA family outer membrane protein